MTLTDSFLALIISLFASAVGAICGIGGGVIIKPTLDLFGFASVSTISFLSCCTVLSMSSYSVIRSLGSEIKIDFKISTPLAVGASVGGVLGSLLFKAAGALFEDPNRVGITQAICLAAVTAGTLLYTLFKDKVEHLNVKGALPCVLIGLILGVISSFLGIGGGPINLAVLFFFFGMQTKVAAANSLYIILFSQSANLLTTVIGGVPVFEWHALVFMIAGGIGGGVIGRAVNKRIPSKGVDRLFTALMALIILISIYNAVKYYL